MLTNEAKAKRRAGRGRTGLAGGDDHEDGDAGSPRYIKNAARVVGRINQLFTWRLSVSLTLTFGLLVENPRYHPATNTRSKLNTRWTDMDITVQIFGVGSQK